MVDIVADYREKLTKKGGRPKVNLPALARNHSGFMKCWLPDPGMVFVSQDVVSLEPSITAELSGDPMYRYATLDGIGQKPYYKNGVLMISDIYLMAASVFPPTREAMRRMFDETMPTGLSFADQWLVDDEVCKNYTKKQARNFAKTACLGIGYGMGWRKFQKTAEEAGVHLNEQKSKVGMHLSVQDAKATIKQYWDLFSGLKALRDHLSWEAKKNGFIVNPFGYCLTPEPHKAFNAYIQSSASGVLDVYCLKLFNTVSDIKFCALVHDEVIYQAPIDRLDQIKTASLACEQSLNSDLGWSVPIRIGWKVARTFAEIKE
jgi:hypothetical protein